MYSPPFWSSPWPALTDPPIAPIEIGSPFCSLRKTRCSLTFAPADQARQSRYLLYLGRTLTFIQDTSSDVLIPVKLQQSARCLRKSGEYLPYTLAELISGWTKITEHWRISRRIVLLQLERFPLNPLDHTLKGRLAFPPVEVHQSSIWHCEKTLGDDVDVDTDHEDKEEVGEEILSVSRCS